MIIQNKYLPPKGFSALNLFGIILLRKGVRNNPMLMNHEYIHTQQMKEMLYVGFYLWYLVEWLIRLPMSGNAYRNISLEREAYANDKNLHYLKKRKHYAWFHYLTRKGAPHLSVGHQTCDNQKT